MLQIDFAAVRAGTKTLAEQTKGFTLADLQGATKELFDGLHSLIATVSNQALVFVPHDAAATSGDEKGWPVAHIVTHLTATLEESCAIAAQLARSVEFDAQVRLRYETPWESMQTVEQVRARLAESRRIALAFLDAWPDEPNLQLAITRIPAFGPLNAIGLCVLGIGHGQLHQQQMAETLNQYNKQA